MVTNEDGFGMREIRERHFVEKDGALRPQTNVFPEPGEGRLSPGNCVPWFKVGRDDSDQPLGSC